MNRRITCVGLAVVLGFVHLQADDWPQWRGPQLNGTSTETGLPVRWSATENITWKLAMPERSGSTPIVWGDHVFVNVGEGAQLALWARGSQQGHRAVEAAARRRQPPDDEAADVVAVAGHRRPHGVGDDRHRRAEGVRPRRHGALVPRHPDGLRPVRAAVGLRVVAAPARGLAVRAGAARHAHRRSVLRAAHRQGQRQDACGASSGRRARGSRSPDAYTTPTLLRHAGGTETRDHRRRRRDRARPGDRARAVAGRRAEPEQRRRLPHRGLAGGPRRPADRAVARAAAAGVPGRRTRRRHPVAPAVVASIAGPTCRRR